MTRNDVVEVREVLRRAMAGAFQGKGWQGPTLLGSVRGVSAAEARVRPGGLKHGVWDYVLHAAYWKYAVCVKMGVVDRDSFPRSPSNWPALPGPAGTASDEKAWRADVRLLRSYHDELVAAVAEADLRRLEAVPAGGRSVRLLDVLVGIAAHDAYHAGQVQLIKRLVRRG